MINDVIDSDMPEYSTEALNALNMFYECDCMIYVEGEDDIVFWDGICKCAGIEKYELQAVGGKEQLGDKVRKVIDENANIIIACDSDYSLLLDDLPVHPQIVTTQYYSIENIMYCQHSLNSLICKLARTTADYTKEISYWINKFVEAVYMLLVYDVANMKFKKGVRVMGNSCARFLTKQGSQYISMCKINAFIDEIKDNFSSFEIEECINLIENCSVEKYNLIRGHFLTTAILNFISKQVKRKKITLSCEHLYTETVHACLTCKDGLCPQLSNICKNMRTARIKINIANS